MITFYDSADNILRQYPGINNVNKVLPFKAGEKYYKLNDDDIVLNADYNEAEYLTARKAERIAEFDAKTSARIDPGFTHQGKIFSSNPVTWRGWKDNIDNGTYTLPTIVTAKNGEPLQLADQAAVDAFIADLNTLYNTEKQAEAALKIAVFNAQTVAELEAIQDER